MSRKKKNKLALGPVFTIIILIFLVILASTILSLLQVDAEKTQIIKGSLETSSVTVNNALTKEGIKYFLSNILTNVQIFKPLVLLIIALITVSIGEASGLFKAIFIKLKGINPRLLTLLVLLLGISGTFIGEYSYIFFLPIIAILYQNIGRKPLLGILTIFIGITLGYGTGLILNNEEIILSILTERAASLEVDQDFIYSLTSNAYVFIVSAIIISTVGMVIIHSVLDKKVPKSTIEEEKELVISKKAIHYSTLAFIVMLLAVIYMIIPGLRGSGILLGEGSSYVEKLFGSNSPFYEAFTFIILLMTMVCGFIYGFISKNIKDSNEYSVGLSKNFEDLGYLFVLLFFTAQLIGLLEWTNLGEIICCGLVNLLSSLSFSALPLMIVFFIAVIVMTVFMPSAEQKWALASPILVPLMMQANLTPSFTQLVFRIADSIGKSITPFFAYFIVMLAFLEKYNTKENVKITVFGTLKMILPTILLFAGLWLLIILGWYITGLPTGPGIYSTF